MILDKQKKYNLYDLRVINELEIKSKKKRKSVPKKEENIEKKCEFENNEDFINKEKNQKKPVKSMYVQNCVSFEEWKKRNKIDKDQKVFICSKEYPDIKNALLNRGWLQNDEVKSPFFDLKWCLKSSDIEHSKLIKNQIVNRFEKTGSLTRKSGLCRNLRNLVWFRSVNIDTFYPKCFDLSEINDFNDFIEEFKIMRVNYN